MASKTTVLQIRLTKAEKKHIKESAKRAELPMSEWLRRAVIHKANLDTMMPWRKPRTKQTKGKP